MNRVISGIAIAVSVALARGTLGAPPSAEAGSSAGLTADANLIVEMEVGVGTRMSGIIDSIQAERGQAVKKGQPLATLDQKEFELDRKAAEAAFSASDADFQRYQELFQQKLSSKAELEQRRARFEQAKVDLAKAKLVIERSVIRAPFDGVVVDRSVKIGQKVQISDTVPLFKISALEPLFARVYLNESWLDQLRVGDSVTVVSSKFSKARSVGRISFLSPVVDSAGGSFQVIVTVPRDRERMFRPGSAVKLTFVPRRPATRE